MLSQFGIIGALSIALAIAGLALTVYGVFVRETRNGLSIAIIGLPILGAGLGLLSLALLMAPVSQ